MFRLINKININSSSHNSSWFKVQHEKAYWIEGDVLYIFGGKQTKVKQLLDSNFKLIKSKERVLVGNNIYGYEIIQQEEVITHEKRLINFKIPFDSKSDEVYFFLRDKKSNTFKSGIYNTKTISVTFIKDSIFNIFYAEENIFITSQIERIDSRGNKIWKFNYESFSSNFEVESIIGIYKNELIIAGNENRLVSINVENGQIIRIWQELKGFEIGQFYKDVIPSPTNFILDQENGMLIGVFYTYYFEINLATGKVFYQNLLEELKSHQINSFRPMRNNPFTNEHLFLTAHADDNKAPNVDIDCVLALNRNTKKVDWVHIFKDAGLGTNIPQITTHNLYQLDLNNTLHFFERL
jgi:hypothetical protein